MRVLLPTDFSKNAKYAIDYAVKMFEDQTVDFYLWNVLRASAYVTDDIMSAEATFTVYEAVTKSSKDALEGLKEDLKIEYNNQKHTFHTVMDYDNFVDSANQMIEKENIDLIVMSTKGANNLEKAIFGSNTLRLIQRTDCPVMVVPESYAYRPIKKIAFTSKYDASYTKKEFEMLNTLVHLENAKVDVIHLMETVSLSDSELQVQSQLDEMIEVPHEFSNVEGDNYFDTIHNYIELKNYDLICVANKKHSFFERLFNLHNVELELENLYLPLLVLKAPNS